MPPDKHLVRAALRLREVYLARAVQTIEQALLERLTNYQRALERTRALLRQVAAENWPTAEPQLRRSLLGLVQAVRNAVNQTSQQLQQPTPPVPDLRCLVEELRQLNDEFGNVEMDFKKKMIHVVTEPIELEDVYLGDFVIQLSWSRLAREAGSQCFEIVAQDPQPAATNDEVTHPHVRSGALCAGDATVPIQRALEQGRLADAFCLVRSVLTHYNSNSPFVSLEQWGGQDCSGCGYGVNVDNLSYCERCGHDYCQDCIGSCTVCNETRCHECLQRCPFCEEWCCLGCLSRSAHSRKSCCRKCLDVCHTCDAEVARDELDSQVQRCPACRAKEPDAEQYATFVDNISLPSQSTYSETLHELSKPVTADA